MDGGAGLSGLRGRRDPMASVGDVRADEERPATGRFVRKPAEDRDTMAVR